MGKKQPVRRKGKTKLYKDSNVILQDGTPVCSVD